MTKKIRIVMIHQQIFIFSLALSGGVLERLNIGRVTDVEGWTDLGFTSAH